MKRETGRKKVWRVVKKSRKRGASASKEVQCGGA